MVRPDQGARLSLDCVARSETFRHFQMRLDRPTPSAGLDGYDPEPLPKDSPLLLMDNVVLSPHMAAHTDDALLRMAMVVTDGLAVIEGRPPEYPVPPPR